MEFKFYKHRKVIVQTFVYLLLFFCLYFVVDFLVYAIDHFRYYPNDKFKYSIFDYNTICEDMVNYNTFYYREPIYINSDKLPVYLFGSSFAFGYNLDKEDTFASLLAKQTNRTVYNFAGSGWGCQHTLFLLENMDFSKIPPPEYIIYIFIDNHLISMLSDQFPNMQFNYNHNLRYKNIDDKLVLNRTKNNRLFFCSYIYRKINNIYITKFVKKNPNAVSQVLRNHLVKMRDIVKIKFPKSHFIVFFYDDLKDKAFAEILRIDGIEFVFIDEFLEKNYKYNDDYLQNGHPNAKAWQEITPLFIKKAQMF